MLTSTREVFGKIEGSGYVSQPIHTFTPGTKNKFQLVQRNKLLEFGYFTDLYRASMSEKIYTKITTIHPLYIVVNYTKQTLIFA